MKQFIIVVLSVPVGAVLGFTVASMWLDHYFHSHGGGNSHADALGVAVACGFGLALGALVVPSVVCGALKCRSQDPAQKRVGERLIVAALGFLVLFFILITFA